MPFAAPNRIELMAGVFCKLCANASAAAESTLKLICCVPHAKIVGVCRVSVSKLLVCGAVAGRIYRPER